MKYRKLFSKAIYNQLANNSDLTNVLGSYTISTTDYTAIYAGQVPEDKREYPYIVLYAPLTPGASVYAFNANGSSDVLRTPSFQLNIYTENRLQIAEIQNIMDLVDDALSTVFTRQGLRLRPKNPTNGQPDWVEDANHWWVWMRWRCTVNESEV